MPARARLEPGPILTICLAVAVAVAALVVVAVRGPGGPPTMQERVHGIAAGLRCPECQNLSVADSPSGLAREMRSEIQRRLLAGQSADAITAYFVSRYGRWILLSPSAGGLGLVAWGAPVLAALVGGAMAFAVLRRRRTRGDGEP
jgi:cytochrome c-type biogenesis protein CcmH